MLNKLNISINNNQRYTNKYSSFDSLKRRIKINTYKIMTQNRYPHFIYIKLCF